MNKIITAKVQRYIVKNINSEDYGVETKTTKDKLEFLFNTFKAEYGWSIQRVGVERSFTDWLRGLPSVIDIEWRNWEILEKGKKLGLLTDNSTESRKDDFLENWFSFITQNTFDLFEKHKIKVY